MVDERANNEPSTEDAKRRGQRNLAIALGLAVFILIVYFVTIMRLGGAVAERSF